MKEQIASIIPGGSWYVVHCKPLKESVAAANLENYLGLETYLPLAVRQGHGRVAQVPLFPGYIFARADLEIAGISKINSIPGILKMLAFGGRPQPLAATIIDDLRRQLDQLNAYGGLPTHDFQPGDVVLIKSGALRGLSAIFAGPTTPSQRVDVLLEFMGRQEIKIGVENLEHGPNPAPNQKFDRRTRGKGRRIKHSMNEEQEAAYRCAHSVSPTTNSGEWLR